MFCLTGLMTLVLLMRKWMSLGEESSFTMMGFSFPGKLDWGSYACIIAKTALFLLRSKFLSPVVALYLYINLPYRLASNAFAMSGLVLLAVTWKY